MRTAKATIADYADSAGRTLTTMAAHNGKLPGDPTQGSSSVNQKKSDAWAVRSPAILLGTKNDPPSGSQLQLSEKPGRYRAANLSVSGGEEVRSKRISGPFFARFVSIRQEPSRPRSRFYFDNQ